MPNEIWWISTAIFIGIMIWRWSKRSERPSSSINLQQTPINPARTPSFEPNSSAQFGLGFDSKPIDQAAIQGLLLQGKKIEAIKQVRLQTNLGLKEAKDYVEMIERGENPSQLMSANRATPQAQVLPEDLLREAQAIARQGNKIQAIKLVRQATNLGLKEAKDMVDRW
ncbi:ribosomal protein L7/L12 [Herpetosiphon geysericola]|uniref:ribosomal protein L7/L12 n=1 Tax=Herpetosiphon geysericola TaxID=70996 RepID=UPI0006C91D5B|nr:ribosomal protein L7/L12 [Herpetosiphon geysericola]